MRALSFLFVFFMFFTFSFGQVTVQTNNLKVNGTAVTNNTINFSSASSVTVSLDVNLSTQNGTPNNVLGNIFLFYKPSSSENEVQVGFSATTFVVTYPPFVTQTTYTSSNVFTSVVLNAANFNNSGGIFYAKYINNNSSSYVSGNINVIGGTRVSNSPLTITSNSICCNQTIRKGDKPAIISSTSLVWSGSGGAYVNGGWYKTYDGVNDFLLSSSYQFGYQPDYLNETTTYYRKIIYNGLTPLSPQIRNFSNSVTITVLQNPIFSNTITTNAIVMDNGSYEISESTPIEFYGINSNVSLDVLADPNHVLNTRTDNIIRVTNYQWQYKSGDASADWIDLTGQTSVNLSPFSIPSGNPKDYFFIRRIAKYQSIGLVSNVLRVVVRKSSVSNTICCNQTLTSTTSGYTLPALVLGSTPLYSSIDGGVASNPTNVNYLYQWQQQSRSFSWTNIAGANSKNYLPPAITTMNTKISYRRVVRVSYISSQQNYYYDTYSNIISVSTPGGRGKMLVNSENNNIFGYNVFPNPSKDNIYIANELGFTNTSFVLYDICGKKLASELFIIDDKTRMLNIYELPKGIYMLQIEDDKDVNVKRIIRD